MLEPCLSLVAIKENTVEYGYESDDSCEIVHEDPVFIVFVISEIDEVQTPEVCISKQN